MLRRAEIVNANHLYTTPITGNYAVKGSEDIILADATAAAITVTLPDATANKNLALYIKKVDSSGNAVTVATSLSQTIDGASTVSLASQYATTTVVSDGANWIIKTVASGSTFTGGTITGATTVSVASATAFVVGPNGTTNPTLTVNTNTASAATGISITGAAAAGGVAIAVTSSGTDENLKIDAKGAGTITIAGTSTGNIILGAAQFAANKNLSFAAGSGLFTMASSSGAFTTSTGTNTLNGNTKIATGKTFSILDTGTVTGAANASTLNKSTGVVTTESATTAAGATFTETITNSQIAAADIVLVQVTTAGTGTPVVTKVTPAAGSVAIVIQNIHASAAFNAALVITFAVIKVT